ncbi:murein hydrolase activator EnvC family protein [Staphylospora marina]|uniref:murein hydrolase activator EnvC family protein n=1 Tax=Staphylospora marina TaxID=2490858 RepID=UPI0019D22863|nr:M23 family metallopeptidase [Staphylospora marina]
MFRKGFVIMVAFCLGMSVMLTDVEAAGSSSDSQKLKEIQQNKKKTESELNKTQSSLKEKEEKVRELETQLGKMKDELAKHQQDLAENEKRLKEQEARFRAMLVRMYEKGESQYLVHLLTAESFSDFLQRFETVRLILKHERNTLDGYIETKQNIQKLMAAIQEQEEKLKPVYEEAKKELGEYQTLYKKQKSELAHLKHQEELTLEAIAEKNRLVAAANAGGSYGSGQLTWPTRPKGTITDYFGTRGGRHEGIDIGLPLGTPIVAADSGVVVLTKSNPGGYGYYVVIDHGNGLKTLYAHMYPSTVRVSVGQRVSKGQQIAEVGNNGKSTGPHLHFETHKNGRPVNPLSYY